MQIDNGLRSEPLSRWVEWGAGELAFLGKREAHRECEAILETLFNIRRPELYLTRETFPHGVPRFLEIISGRKNRVPLAYLVGRVPFWDDELEVEKGVFIPRPETEILIEAFIRKDRFSSTVSFRFLDVGAGSGNIAVTVSRLFPRSYGVASDLSSKALTVAERNAARAGVTCRLQGVQADGLSAFGKESFDVIFSNPPYIASGELEGLEEEVRQEPLLALVGGKEGMDFYHRLSAEFSCLSPGGSLWMEVGWGQAQRVKRLFEKKGFEHIEIFKDLDQIERVVGARGFRG